tara:strand:+ start:5079 stop:5312 length:234 start_codon:yes stop_codon:yes gene_type:complete
MVIEEIRHLLDEEAIMLDGLDEAAIGYTQDGLLIYNYELMLDLFMKQNEWTRFEAEEWVDFNVLALLDNGSGFVVCF